MNPDEKTTVNVTIQNMVDTLIKQDATKEQVGASFEEFAKQLESEIMATVQTAKVNNLSMEHMYNNPKYNIRPLTVEEKKFYNAVSITDNTFKDTPMPVTIFERVFEDLKADHPLLSLIDMQNTNGVMEWVLRDGEVAAAQWGKPCDEIKKQLDMAFKKETLQTNKLSAFVNICKSMLVIGPEWLDRFIREMLQESLAMGLENAVIAGTGVDQPIGMLKDLAKPFDPSSGWTDKVAIPITDLSVKTIGEKIIAPLTNEGKRNVDVAGLVFLVNPLDYWNKIFSTLTVRNINGEYVTGKTPIGANIVSAAAVPVGKMIVGKAKNYFLGVSMNQRVDYSDEYRFVEDDRVYIVKMLAHGKPVNNLAFQVFDISKITGVPQA